MRDLHDNGPNRCHQCHVKAKISGKNLEKTQKSRKRSTSGYILPLKPIIYIMW